MFSYLKKVIENPNNLSPSSHRFVVVISAISLCVGFLCSTAGLLMGVAVSDTVVLGLAGILATLAGANYVTANMTSKKDEGEDK